MNTFIAILLSVIFMVFLLFVALMMSPKTQTKSVNINLPNNAGVKISQNQKGVSLDIEYNSWEDRPSDAELFPDIVDDTPPQKNALDRSFWQMYANFDNLTVEEREEVLRRLVEHGIIAPSEVEKFTLMDDGQDSTPSNEESEPSGDAEPGSGSSDGGEDDIDLNPGQGAEGEYPENNFANHDFDS